MLNYFAKGEELFLCLLLATMILLACVQIVLRTFFASGLLWADPLLRYLVLWCGLLGAVTATGQGKHIALDLTPKKLPRKINQGISLVNYLFCVLASAGLTWAGCRFLASEIEFGASGPLSLPLWFWSSIFPVCFGLITIKYIFFLSMSIVALFSPDQEESRNRL